MARLMFVRLGSADAIGASVRYEGETVTIVGQERVSDRHWAVTYERADGSRLGERLPNGARFTVA
jgi:hypothetical protein